MSDFLYINREYETAQISLTDINSKFKFYRCGVGTLYLSEPDSMENHSVVKSSCDRKLAFHVGRPRSLSGDVKSSKNLFNDWFGDGVFPAQFNGYGALLGIDSDLKTLMLSGDALGFYPLFCYVGQCVVVGSNLLLVHRSLAAMGISTTFNMSAIAEFISCGSALHPDTYCDQIFQLHNGSQYTFCLQRNSIVKKTPWWDIDRYKELNFKSYDEAAEELEGRLKTAVRSVMQQIEGRVGVLLSAGADSRAILFGAPDPSSVQTYTLYDDENEELRNARLLADIAGASNVSIRRDPKYYFQHLAASVRKSSGMWSLDSAHYEGLLPYFFEDRIGTVLSGCYADYLFKGLAIDRTHRTFFGKNIPLYKQSNQISRAWYQPIFQLSNEFRAVVEARLARRYGECEPPTDHNSVNKVMAARLTPMIREADASGRHTLRVSGLHDFIFADLDLIDMAFSMPVQYRLNGIVFGKAVSRMLPPRAKKVLNNNYGARLRAGEVERLAYFIANSLKRKISKTGGLQPFELNDYSVGTHGSWPHFPAVLTKTDVVEEWYENNKESCGYQEVASLFDSEEDWSDRNFWASNGRSQLFMRVIVAVEMMNQLRS